MLELQTILSLPEGPGRTAAVAAWLQGLYDADIEKPILVGGAAVELYTGGAYTTGDLDFVGSVSPTVALGLKSAGFSQRGRKPDLLRVKSLAGSKGVPQAAQRLTEAVERWKGRDPTQQELAAWARSIPGE